MTTNPKQPEPETTSTETEVQRRTTYGRRVPPDPIQVTDPAVADSLNKKTVGIQQLSDIYDLQRLKKQNELNRNLVAINHDLLRQATGELGGGGEQPGGDAMTTNETGISAGPGADADDNVQIGDTSYNINVGQPEQLEAVLDHLRNLQAGQQGQQQGGPAEPAGPPTGTTITTPPTTPVTVGPIVQPAPAPAPAQPAPPREKTLGEKLLPWALAAATGLAGAGITYGLTRPSTDDTNTEYRLEFDEEPDPGATIPTPRLD